jgi:hypothetical protein
MILSLDRIPNYQNWLVTHNLDSSDRSSIFFAIAKKTNRTEFPKTHRFLNSGEFLEPIARQDQDCLAEMYLVQNIYCLRYRRETNNVDIVIYDNIGNAIATHRVAFLSVKKGQISIKYTNLVDAKLFTHDIDNNTVRKQILQLINDLEISISCNSNRNIEAFLSDRQLRKKAHSKSKKNYIPKKRDRTYNTDYR